MKNFWFVVVAALAACSGSESVSGGAGSGPVTMSAPAENGPVSGGGPTGSTAAHGSVAKAIGEGFDSIRDTAVEAARQLASEAFAPSDKLVALLGTNPRLAVEKWPYMAYAYAAEEAVCANAVGKGSVPVWRMGGTVVGCEWCSYHFYCAAANGVLTPVQPPVCNRRDAARNWYNKDLQAACAPASFNREWGNRILPETARMLNAAFTVFMEVETECGTPRLTHALYKTVQEQLWLYIDNCIFSDTAGTGAHPVDAHCGNNETSTCKPFREWPQTVVLRKGVVVAATREHERVALYDALSAAAIMDTTLCPHTGGAAVDVLPYEITMASVHDNPRVWQNSACARELDRVMAAHGFCSLSSPELKNHGAWEPWHYEFPKISKGCVDPMLQYKYRGVPEPDPDNHDTAP